MKFYCGRVLLLLLICFNNASCILVSWFYFLLCKALWATLLVLNVPSIVKYIKTKYNFKKCNYISINIISVSIYKWELNLIESELNFSDELLRSLRFLRLWRQVLYILSVLEVPTVLCGPKLVCLRLWGWVLFLLMFSLHACVELLLKHNWVKCHPKLRSQIFNLVFYLCITAAL